jgi:hypothetical protein
MQGASMKAGANPQGQTRPAGSSIKPTTKVYWLRFLMAVIAGIANGYLHISSTQPLWGDLAQYVGIGVGACFYALSVLIVRYLFKYGEVELKGKHRDITLGGGTFIVVWVMVLVLVNSLLSS